MNMIQRPSPNFNPRPGGTDIDILVFHYTGMKSAAAALERMCDPGAEVSAHYMIDEDGSTYQLVGEASRAWHAGVSNWRGNSNINDRSIGIELVNPGHEFGYQRFAQAQMTALITLAKDILARHPIPARNVVGHSDIAPTRKQDPGEFFAWAALAAEDIGYWPAKSSTDPHTQPTTSDLAPILEEYGYDTDDMEAALLAFQRHFHPSNCSGQADAESVEILGLVNLELHLLDHH